MFCELHTQNSLSNYHTVFGGARITIFPPPGGENESHSQLDLLQQHDNICSMPATCTRTVPQQKWRQDATNQLGTTYALLFNRPTRHMTRHITQREMRMLFIYETETGRLMETCEDTLENRMFWHVCGGYCVARASVLR